MTRRDVIDFCLTLPGAYEDYPFDQLPGKGATTVMRHMGNKRSFALIMDRGNEIYVNLKCNPLEADLLRRLFRGVIPGYHMNKTHWNTLILGSDVPDGELRRQIEGSYDLTKPKAKSPRKRSAN